MRNIIKINWVFWIYIRRYKINYYHKVRGANYFEFVKFGLLFNIGMPWHKHYVEYECNNFYGNGKIGIDRINKILLNSPGLKIKMPKVKYLLN